MKKLIITAATTASVGGLAARGGPARGGHPAPRRLHELLPWLRAASSAVARPCGEANAG